MAISFACLASFAHLRRKLHNQRLVEQTCLPQRHDSRTTNRKFNWQISSDSPALAVISYLACRVVGNNAVIVASFTEARTSVEPFHYLRGG